jgi:hypothetical protein
MMMNRTNRTVCKVAFSVPLNGGNAIHVGNFRLWRHPTNGKTGFTFLIQLDRTSQYRTFLSGKKPANVSGAANQACGQPPNIH